jgi:hypothetical protein
MAETINLAPVRVHAISVTVQPPPNSIVGPAEMFLQQGENGGVQIDVFWRDAMGNEVHESKEMQEEDYEALRASYLHSEQASLPPFSSFKSGNTIGRVVGETAPAAVPASQANPPIEAETEEEGITGEQILDGIQLGLDVVGLIPVVGEVADIASGVISLFRGDYVGAGLSLLSAIPFVGYAGTAGKAARHSAKMAEASGKGSKEVVDRATREAAEKRAKEAAEKRAREEAYKRDLETKDGQNGTKVKTRKNSREKGKCGEWLASMDMIADGFDEVISVENNSGHGVDLIGRNSRTGEVKVWEVKTTDGTVPGPLSKDQKKYGGEGFTNDRLAKAARGSGNYGKVPAAMHNAQKAQGWLDDAINNKLPPTYQKYDVFVDDLEKGCSKHPNRPAKRTPW